MNGIEKKPLLKMSDNKIQKLKVSLFRDEKEGNPSLHSNNNNNKLQSPIQIWNAMHL